MNFLAEVRHRFRPALERLAPDATRWLEMIRTSQNPRHGDYQVNCDLPLEKTLGRPAREIAAELLGSVELSDLGDAEVAGPGFVNLRLAAAPLAEALRVAILDERLGVRRVDPPRTFVVDFSSPNVAKTMHVGHIRSTVLGDALSRILRFVGHRVITDNHLGDWGTQFGMILYGFKHLTDAGRYAAQPVEELNRLYRRVRQIGEYQEAVEQLPAARRDLERDEAMRRQLPATDPTIPAAESRIAELRARWPSWRSGSNAPRAIRPWWPIPSGIRRSKPASWTKPLGSMRATPRTAACGENSCRTAWKTYMRSTAA